MPIDNIDRNAYTRNVTSAVTLRQEDYIVIANATGGGFTITLTDYSDGAEHNVLIQIAAADVSGNTVAVSGNAGAFTVNLASNANTSEWLKTRQDGTWFIAGERNVTTTAVASSAAASAGVAASTADSKAVSDSIITSTAQSGVNSNSINISKADSKAVSDSIITSTAQSGVNSNSINISVADSKGVSDSVVISSLTSRVSSKGN